MSQPTKNVDAELDREIGVRIMKLRGEESQSDLAAAVGVSREIIQHWERGTRHIKAGHLAAIARHYNVSADYLLGLTEHPTTNADLRTICDYTGLKQGVVSKMHEYIDSNLDILTILINALLGRFCECDNRLWEEFLAASYSSAIASHSPVPPLWIDNDKKWTNKVEDVTKFYFKTVSDSGEVTLPAHIASTIMRESFFSYFSAISEEGAYRALAELEKQIETDSL